MEETELILTLAEAMIWLTDILSFGLGALCAMAFVIASSIRW